MRSDPDAGVASDSTREIAEVVDRIGRRYPDLPEAMVAEVVERAFADLRDARVKSFRSILAERSVRRRLDGVDAPAGRVRAAG